MILGMECTGAARECGSGDYSIINAIGVGGKKWKDQREFIDTIVS